MTSQASSKEIARLLRLRADGPQIIDSLLLNAADEIERLETDRDEWKSAANRWMEDCLVAQSERAAPEPGLIPIDAQVIEDLMALTQFAYERGFHELGYDPVRVIVDASTQPPGALHDGVRSVQPTIGYPRDGGACEHKNGFWMIGNTRACNECNQEVAASQAPGVCECIPMAPRPYNFCQDCGGRIAPTKGGE
jgi:hypothetical protein